MIFQGLYFLNTSPIFEGSEIVCSKKTFPPSLLIYIYVGCVRRSSWCPTTLDTLLNNSYEVGTLLHCCTLVWWYKGRKLNGLVFRASLITKDNIAEYLQSQRRKKAILQVPEPFVIRLLNPLWVEKMWKMKQSTSPNAAVRFSEWTIVIFYNGNGTEKPGLKA